VYLVFRGQMTSPVFSPGAESLEVRLFALEDIPWNEIAFPVVGDALRRYVQDRARGQFPVHLASLPEQVPF
jgi:hypothetical protein